MPGTSGSDRGESAHNRADLPSARRLKQVRLSVTGSIDRALTTEQDLYDAMLTAERAGDLEMVSHIDETMAELAEGVAAAVANWTRWYDEVRPR